MKFVFPLHMRFQIVSLFLIIIISCQEKKSNQQQEIPEIEIKDVIMSYENCSTDSINCTYVHIEYPEFSDSAKFNLNEIISVKLKDAASYYFREENIEGTIEHIAQSFIRDFEAFKMDFPKYQFGWYVKIYSEIIYESDRLISFRIDSESFTGGAHPNSSTGLFVVDKQTENKLSTLDLISDTTRFKKLLEEEFRKIKGMSNEQSFADRGFYINDGDFLLTDNIGLTDESVIVHFNPYEIAPYSEGATTLELNRDFIEDLLKVY